MKNIFKGNIFLWLMGGLILFAVGKKLFKAKATTPVTEVAPASAPAPTTELGYLLRTGDWTNTVPGKAIEGWLGQGTANWVIWSAIVVFVLFFIRDFVSKDNKTGNILTVLYVCAAAVIVAMVFGGTIQTYGKLKEVPVISEIDFRRAPEGHTVVTDMALNTIAVVRLGISPVARGANWACPETIRPAKLPFIPYFEVVAGKNTSQNHIKLTEESQKQLLENGTMGVTVRFTHTTAPNNPCANLR